MATKQAREAQLQQIFRMLLESKSQEDIAHELNVALKTVQRYTLEIDKRYGEAQRQKTDDTLFMECQLFKNRMLTLYKIAEEKAADPKASGTEVAKCIEVAANISVDVLKMESEGIKAVKELGFYGKTGRLLNAIQSKYEREQSEQQQEESIRDNNIIQQSQPNEQQQPSEPSRDLNRKF